MPPPTEPTAGHWPLLERHWPALFAGLGERRADFETRCHDAAGRHLEADEAAMWRYCSLCCVFGPGFEDKPEHEWALAVLADQRLSAWTRSHQLLLRARRALERLRGDAATLLAADTALLDALDAARRGGDPDAVPLPRVACDVDGIDLRLSDMPWRQEYQPAPGPWRLVPLSTRPAPLRIDAATAAPARIAVLSHPAGHGPQAELQLRQLIHGGCERHPALRWLGSHGLVQHGGPSARIATWTLPAPQRPPPTTGLGLALAEAVAPDVGLLQWPSCGVRDDGAPVGPQALQLWTYPAQQWLFQIQRDALAPMAWTAAPGSDAAAPPVVGPTAAATPSTLRLERDGKALDARAWLRGFDVELPAAFAAALSRLAAAWQASARDGSLQAGATLFGGRQSLTWGWREGAGGLAGEAVLRVVGDLDLQVALTLSLGGVVEVAGARSAITLTVAGQAGLQRSLRREQAEPALDELVAGAVLPFSFPFALHADPVARDDGLVASPAGPCTGTLGGELGLRPRLSGGSGWQWYLRLASEPVMAPYIVHDPVLGNTRHTLALLPALALLDWSLG